MSQGRNVNLAASIKQYSVGDLIFLYGGTPILSVPGALGLCFLLAPSAEFSGGYKQLFEVIAPWLLGLICLAVSGLSFLAIVCIGPEECGLTLPNPSLMMRSERYTYMLGLFPIWSGLFGLGCYFFAQNSFTGFSTYGAVALAVLVRVYIALRYVLFRR